MMKKNNLKKDFIWNSLGSTIHAFNSLFFLIIVTRINGLEVAGYFSYGFTLSSIFLVIASFGGRGYQVTDIKKEFNYNTYKSFRYMTTIVSLIISILILLTFKYNTYKYLTIIFLLLVRAFESISDVYFGILQQNNELYKVGKSLFYKSLISLIVFLLIEILFKSLIVAIISSSIINLLFLVFIDIKNVKKIRKGKFKIDKSYYKIIKKTFYFFAFNFLSMFLLNIPRYFIDFNLSDKLQGVYGILIMPATFVILLTQFILQPYAVRLSLYMKENKKVFKTQINKIFKTIIIISLICILTAYILGISILNFIYGVSFNSYKLHLCIVMIGASFFALNSFLGLIYTIGRKTKYQFIVYLITIFLSFIFSYFLIYNLSLLGGVISYTLIMAIIFIFYIINFKKIINN